MIEKSVQEVVLRLKIHYLNMVFQKKKKRTNKQKTPHNKRMEAVCFPFDLLKQFFEKEG